MMNNAQTLSSDASVFLVLLPIDTDKSEDKIPESFRLPPDKHCHHQAYQGLSLAIYR